MGSLQVIDSMASNVVGPRTCFFLTSQDEKCQYSYATMTQAPSMISCPVPTMGLPDQTLSLPKL